MGEIELIVIISVLLLIAPFVSNILKLPIAVVEIMMGSLVGTFGLLHESHLFELLSEVGFLYLMFLAGMEVNLKQFVKIDKKIFLLGGLFLSFLFLLTVIFVKFFHLSNIFIVILPMISVGLIVSVQKEVGKSEWIEMAITVGVIGELLSIILLTVISGIFKLGMGSALYFSILKLIILITILIVGFYFIKVLFWWFPTIKHYIMPDDDKYNQDIRLSFALFFIMISIMIYLHLDVVLGAFVAGMFITSFFEHNVELEHKLAPFGFGFLITLFFIHVGSTFNLKYLVDLHMLKITFLVVALMLGIRIVASLVFIKIMNLREILLFALSLSMPLTLLIATSTLAYQAQSIDLMHYNAFILASILEVLIAMVGIKQVLKIKIDKSR
jgi:Kef-type K+ transport system membrane component KefB